jgi:hypothetical protein
LVSLKVITAMHGSHRHVGPLLPQRTAGVVEPGCAAQTVASDGSKLLIFVLRRRLRRMASCGGTGLLSRGNRISTQIVPETLQEPPVAVEDKVPEADLPRFLCGCCVLISAFGVAAGLTLSWLVV